MQDAKEQGKTKKYSGKDTVDTIANQPVQGTMKQETHTHR